MSISNKLRIAANPAERRLVGRAAAVALILPVLLRFCGIERIVAFLTPPPPARGRRQPSRERIAYVCLRMLGAYDRLWYRSNCLRRSLLLYHCLRTAGTPAVIHFGVKQGSDALLGHCWLTVDGVLVNDRAEMVSQFTPMFTLPRSAPDVGPASSDTKERDLDGVLFVP